MATLPPIISRTYVEGTIIDSLGQVDEVDSLVTDNNPAPGRLLRQALTNGDNTIFNVSGQRGVIITFEETCNTVKFLKGVIADTGIQVSTAVGSAANGTFMILFGLPTPASFVINSVGIDAGITQVCWF